MAQTDVASLAIRVESLQVSQADRRLRGLASSGGSAARATSGFTGTITKLLGPLTAVVSAGAALSKVVSVQRQFDVLNAGLITATGGLDGAAVAFDALQQFAAKTPYSLDQAVQGFTKLVNLGLTPSERALNSYGNTASAMGKDLMQLVEAVADASTGEFERLKEFGIKAKQQGDQVSLTFQGVTTKIGNNAAEIEGYLQALGENQFAGAMQTRMDSLDGALSNLGDSWNRLFLNVSQSGVGDVIEKAVRLAIVALDEINAMLASGELEGYLTAIGSKFGAWADDIHQTFAILTTFINDNFGEWGSEGESTVNFLIDAFKNLPENVRALIQLMVIEVASGLDRVQAYAGAFKDGIAAVFNDDTIAGVGQRLETQLQSLSDLREGFIKDILDERDASIESTEAQIAAAKKLREEYDKQQAAKAASTEDRLAQFGVGSKGGGASSGVDKTAAAAEKARAREFQSLKDALRTEEEALAESYTKRKAIIEANTSAESDARRDLMSRLDANHSEEVAKLEERKGAELASIVESLRSEEEAIQESYNRRLAIVQANTEEGAQGRADLEAKLAGERDTALADLESQRQSQRDQLYNGLLTEEEMLLQSYERKKQMILSSEEVTETERQDLLRRLKQQFDDETAQAEAARTQSMLKNGEQLFSGLSGLAKTYAGEQSGAYKALFAVSKAFSIAQAGMSIATGLAKAQELGFPANMAEMARVAATGAGIVSQINGSQFAGAYDQGGQIPSGKIGIVGEYGPELVRGPASVTGRELTQRLARGQGDATPAPAPQVNVRNINVLDPQVVGDYLDTDEGEQLIMNVVQRNQSIIGG